MQEVPQVLLAIQDHTIREAHQGLVIQVQVDPNPLHPHHHLPNHTAHNHPLHPLPHIHLHQVHRHTTVLFHQFLNLRNTLLEVILLK